MATDYLNFFASKLKECRMKSFEIVEIYRKTDVPCFTQGLIFDRKEVTLADGSTEVRGVLVEACGKIGTSRV